METNCQRDGVGSVKMDQSTVLGPIITVNI